MIDKHVLFSFIHTFHSVLSSLKSKMLLQILMIVHFYISNTYILYKDIMNWILTLLQPGIAVTVVHVLYIALVHLAFLKSVFNRKLWNCITDYLISTYCTLFKVDTTLPCCDVLFIEINIKTKGNYILSRFFPNIVT